MSLRAFDVGVSDVDGIFVVVVILLGDGFAGQQARDTDEIDLGVGELGLALLEKSLGGIERGLEWTGINGQLFLAGRDFSAVGEKSGLKFSGDLRLDGYDFLGGGFSDFVEIDGDVGGGDGGDDYRCRGHGEAGLLIGAIAAGHE